MEVMAGYKQTEMGVVPEDWEVLPFDSFFSFISYGFTNPMPTTQSGIYMITAKDIDGGTIQYDTARFTSEEAYRTLLTDKSRPRKGDLLLTKDGALGRVALVGDKTICINQSVAIIRLNNKAVPEFVKILLEAPVYQQRMLEDAGGTTIKHIYITIIDKMPLVLPSNKAEQKAIAEALSDADALIEALEQLLAKKRQVKQGAMQDLLTGKKRVVESGKWEVKTFGELFNISGGLSASRDQLSSEGYCYLHYGDIHLSHKSFIDVNAEFQDIPKLNVPLNKVSSTSLLNDGDIVFVDASEDDEGASKHVVVVNPDGVPYISGLHTIVAKSKTDELNNLYKRYCFQTRAVKKQFLFYSVGTKVTGISKTNIAKITLPVPSLPEQTAIAEILSDMDAEIAALEGKLSKAREVKAGMMSVLLTGKIRLNHD